MRTAAVESTHADHAALIKGNTRMGAGKREILANRPLRKDLALATMVGAERGLALAMARGTGSTEVELPCRFTAEQAMPHSHARFRVLALTAALVTVGAFAAIMPVAPKAPSVAHDWVRTVDGWQRATWRASARFEPGLHPAVAALELALLSILFLVAFSRPAMQNAAAGSTSPQLDPPVRRPHAWKHRAEHEHRQPLV